MSLLDAALSLLAFVALVIPLRGAFGALAMHVRLISTCPQADYDWPHSPPSHSHSSPDTTSPMYPDRLIRPLPKRRLRSRLSEEEAKTIEFPPAPPTVSPLFNLPYVEQSPSYANRVPRGDGDDHKCQCGADHGVGSDSAYADDYDGQNERAVRRGGSTNAEQDYVSWEQAGGFSKPPPPGSAASSADGYESFENTNNKKKRKIPLSGGSNHHHSSLSAEMVNMSISGSAGDGALVEGGANGERPYYNAAASSSGTTSSSGTGISGAGRGRFGRPKHSLERRPLGASTNGVNAFASNYSGNGAKGKRDWAAGGAKDQGIISAAIANAAEEDDSLPPLEGSENISLLEQQAAKRAPPQTSQFTFSMDSESGRALYGAAGNPPPNAPPGATYAPLPAHSKTRAGVAYPPNAVPPAAAQQQQYQQHHPQQYQQQQQQQQPPPQGVAAHGGQGANQRPPRPRKPLSRLYQLAARQRKLQQEYQNYNTPPTNRDDIWVCEFCEYEAIFGTEPAALVRQYEEKDRRERKRAAEKRRLLEKAKMKGRKNRKAKGKNKGSNSQANNAAHNPAGSNQHYDQGMDNLAPQGLDAQEEEFFDEEFDDEPIEQGAPPPPPTPTPTGYNVTQVNSGMGYPKASGGGYMPGSSTIPQGQPRALPASRTRKA